MQYIHFDYAIVRFSDFILNGQLKSTSELLKEIVSESKNSDANLRILVRQIYLHQHEDKSLDEKFEFNGDFEDNSAVYSEKETS